MSMILRPVLVTGGGGQLASALARLAPAALNDGMRLIIAGRPQFDFARPATLDAIMARVSPALVINTAAYTAVDAAESEPDAAIQANKDGPARLARLCIGSGVPLIHLSTDYVFNGMKGAPYLETDSTDPQGVYGSSKRDGELAVMAAHNRATILRTSWVYGPTGRNFIRTILDATRTGENLRVVADQLGNPTAAPDLAQAILRIAQRVLDVWHPSYAGLFHITGTGSTSWHGFASEALRLAARRGRPAPLIQPIATQDWPTPARRPPDSRLDCGKLAKTFGITLPRWQESLPDIVAQMLVADPVH